MKSLTAWCDDTSMSRPESRHPSGGTEHQWRWMGDAGRWLYVTPAKKTWFAQGFTGFYRVLVHSCIQESYFSIKIIILRHSWGVHTIYIPLWTWRYPYTGYPVLKSEPVISWYDPTPPGLAIAHTELQKLSCRWQFLLFGDDRCQNQQLQIHRCQEVLNGRINPMSWPSSGHGYIRRHDPLRFSRQGIVVLVVNHVQ